RLTVYELDAQNNMIKGGRRASLLTIGGYYEVRSKNKVRKFSDSSLKFKYIARQGRRGIHINDLNELLRPYVYLYMHEQFLEQKGQSFDVWMNELSKAYKVKKKTKKDVLRNMLLNIRIQLPSAVNEGWFKLNNADKKQQLTAMTEGIQARLKEVSDFYFLSDKAVLMDERELAIAVIAYASIPKLANRPTQFDREPYWSTADHRVKEILKSDAFKENFDENLEKAAKLLEAVGANSSASFYHPGKAKFHSDNICASIDTNQGDAGRFLRDMIDFEYNVIEKIIDAAQQFLKFKEQEAAPEKAVEAFQKFGEELTDAFNGFKLPKMEKKSNWSGALTPILFFETAQAFGMKKIDFQSTTLMDILFLNNSTNKELKHYVEEGEQPDGRSTIYKDQILAT
ncbi:MAG: hypothetical protein AAF598_18895, partial [Bacteroidota bacterium]